MVRTNLPNTIVIIFSQYINSTKRSQSGKHTVRLVHVDTTQLDLKHEFKLSRVQPPNDGDSGETIYEVKPSEQPSQDIQVKSNPCTRSILSILELFMHFLKAKDIKFINNNKLQ